MELQYFQVNAFSNNFNGGNPAGVCPLEEWLPDELMQAVAKENNLSETAFFVKNDNAFDLRWFTPCIEVDLCGHATLASAHVLFSAMHFSGEEIIFNTKTGQLVVKKENDGYEMKMQAIKSTETEAPENLLTGLGHKPSEIYKGIDYMLVYDDAEVIRQLEPEYSLVQDIDLRGTIVTAPSPEEDVDFVSRFFGSAEVGINEDPATGSAHCALAPYWSERLSKSDLVGKQMSPRGATLKCRVRNGDVYISGKAVTYLSGKINIEHKN